MKKIVALMMALVMVFALTACGGKFKCGICGEEKSGKKYTEELLGQELTYCKDCKDGITDMFGGLN